MDAGPGRAQFVRFGVFELDRHARELRKQGRRMRLQDQPFQVLSMLLDRTGSVVTREELRTALWPGSVYVDFDHGLNNAVARLREALGDSAASPRYIETLPRLGYRFIYPLTDGTLVPESPASVAPAEPASPSAPATGPQPASHGTPKSPRYWPVWAAIAIIVAATAAWLLLGERRSDAPQQTAAAIVGAADTPSVAVLPFASLSDDPDDIYFAAGLSGELLSQLSHIEGLKVAGSVSSFQFKDRAESPADVARALGVDHLLEGSVRRSGNHIRITAQLIDANSGYSLWSQTFEREFRDIFAIQEEIGLAVAKALQVRLLESETQRLRLRGTDDVEAYRLYLMGIAQLRALGVRMNREGARQLFEQAIALDPGFAAAHAGVASYYFNLTATLGTEPETSARLGRAAAERAMALDPGDSDALRTLADFEMWSYRFRGEGDAYGRADALFRRAVEIDPANAYAWFDYARAIQWTEPRRALPMFDRAVELDALAPAGIGLGALAMARLGMREAARQRLQEFVSRSSKANRHNVVAAFESYFGNLDGAVEALQTPTSNDVLGSQFLLWAMFRSMGDADAAQALLQRLGDDPLAAALRKAADLGSRGHYADAFAHLDRQRVNYPTSRVLDLPAARFALIAGRFDDARVLLEDRLPDLAAGTEPITAPRVMPALDLVLAWQKTGRTDEASRLLQRVAAFLDSTERPQLPLFEVQRARAQALSGDTDLALQSLEYARDQGFRVICALDMHPHPLLYVDCLDADPVLAGVRKHPRYAAWIESIEADNRAQLARLRSRPGPGSAG